MSQAGANAERSITAEMERDGAVNPWRMEHCTLPGVATLASFGLGTRYTLALNRSASVHNTPLKSTDPTGHWIESAVARACIADDIWDIPQNGLTWDTGLALAADVGGLLLPGLTGLGMAVRGGKALARTDDILDVVRAVSWTERFAGASPEIRRGITWLEKMVQDERIPDSYRRSFAAELLRAEEYFKAGKLQAVEAVVEGRPCRPDPGHR